MTVLFRKGPNSQELRVAEELLFVTGLSRDLGPDGRLSEGGRAGAWTALNHFASRLKTLGITTEDVRAVATAGIRRSTDGLAFLRDVQRELSLDLRVITGNEEADLSALAQERSFPRRCPLLVADIGGRSTELALRLPGRTVWKTSLELGSVLLAEDHGSDVPALEKSIHRTLAPWAASLATTAPPTPSTAPLVGVAGTVTTALQLVLGTQTWDPGQLHGKELQRGQLDSLINRLGAMTAEQRRAIPGLHPGRADLIVAGLCLLVALMDVLGRTRVLVSDRGVRYGLLWKGWPMARIQD